MISWFFLVFCALAAFIGAASKPPTTASGQVMADGKDFPASQAGAVNAKKTLLTHSRPNGKYKGTDPIMIDFQLSKATLIGDSGMPKMIEKWEPIWPDGWSNGKQAIRIELVDQKGDLVDNGGYNSTTREITVVK